MINKNVIITRHKTATHGQIFSFWASHRERIYLYNAENNSE